YSNVILDYYRMVDNWLDSLFSFNTNIMIVSDHGQGKMLRYVNFNAWLMSKNLLALTAEGGERLGQDDTITTMKINGQSYYAKIKPMITASDIDWNRTKAYSANNASININLQGREVQGCVKEGEEYHNIRTYLKEELLKVKDTNGQCIVEEVFSREDLYEGEEVSKLPDIIFAYKNDSFYYNPSINVGYFPSQEIIYDEAPEYCFELERSAEHTRYGIFIAYGPDINEGEKIQGAENIDIAPTALHILRTPVPEDIEGKVLKEIFKKDSPLATFETLQEKIEKSDSPQTCQEYGYTEEEEKDIERRLRELGYL
ncbi:MAG: alkaline phosphatase family protein, partial [Deltaproteobacteria bacterium]|nr:alkaline phosphatase family protein [Deltaproteobacteria bacterium]